MDKFDLTLYDPATGKPIWKFSPNVMHCRGNCGKSADGGQLVEDRDDLLFYFIPAGPANAIAFWTHSLTDIPPGVVVMQQNYQTAYKTIQSEASYVEDFTTNKRKSAVCTQGLQAKDYAYAAGAQDGSVFLLVTKAGGLLLYSDQDGKVITSLDRFKLS